MISLPPSDSDLHAYVDHQLSEQDRRLLEHYLASHPQVAARVQAWQQDAQHLRAALGGALLQPANPALDPVQIRARLKQRSLRRLASAAVLLVAVGVGGLSGWQARELTLAGSSVLPMTDALQAYRLFAEQGMLPADFKVQGNQSMQAWLDRYFTQASPLPDLQGAGFMAVSGRLLSTEQGPAAMVLYEDRAGRKVSFYIRPPGPQNKLLPPGSRREGPLQAQYWSGQGYNYAMVGPAEIPL
ncbi:transmembrane regulator PrtR [Pseudomonas protegens Cab57]|uniref:anti-sigma factor family protein n=1 Tax=Pseudomonas protegens TaxID=380021 RepID=UPI0004424589|nr:anti-sigma factor [Pseudomonas protegens]WRV89578.1 anti-sigma factor [Pseudomonas protegens]BAO63394.1 transmembrane regulator PrtR [Pseudomonas protegens Cab57]